MVELIKTHAREVVVATLVGVGAALGLLAIFAFLSLQIDLPASVLALLSVVACAAGAFLAGAAAAKLIGQGGFFAGLAAGAVFDVLLLLVGLAFGAFSKSAITVYAAAIAAGGIGGIVGVGFAGTKRRRHH